MENTGHHTLPLRVDFGSSHLQTLYQLSCLPRCHSFKPKLSIPDLKIQNTANPNNFWVLTWYHCGYFHIRRLFCAQNQWKYIITYSYMYKGYEIQVHFLFRLVSIPKIAHYVSIINSTLQQNPKSEKFLIPSILNVMINIFLQDSLVIIFSNHIYRPRI